MLGQILMQKKLISSSQLEAAIGLQTSSSKKLGELLIMEGLIQDSQLQQALKEQYWRRNGFGSLDISENSQTTAITILRSLTVDGKDSEFVR